MQRLDYYLRQHSERFPDKTAVVCGGESLTYSQLYAMAEKSFAELLSTAGKTVIRRALPTVDFFVDYFASHIAGKPFVPLEADIPDERLQEITALVENSQLADGVADILFTSGTTGKPKGTMLSHKAIAANADNLVCAQGFSPDVAFIINGPLNHIGSLSKLWPTIMVGGTVVIVDGMKDLDAFFAALDYPSAKVATFLVPASLRMLLMIAADRMASYSERIDFIETGAAPMAQNDMERLCRILPKTRLYNTYASTETGIIATHDYQHCGCVCGLLGRPMKHSRLLFTPEGTIACQGDTLMSGYVGDDELTRKVLHGDTLYTHDIGHLDAEGRLVLDGRDDDAINVGGFKVFPIEVENAAKGFAGLGDCICIASPHPIMGNVLKLIYVASTPIDKPALAAYLKTRLERHKVPTLYEPTDHIERTPNGKLNRRSYMENKEK